MTFGYPVIIASGVTFHRYENTQRDAFAECVFNLPFRTKYDCQ